MLDDLNDETDFATTTLNAVTKQTKEFVRQAGRSVVVFLLRISISLNRALVFSHYIFFTLGGMKYCCIIIALSVLLLILTYLVLIT